MLWTPRSGLLVPSRRRPPNQMGFGGVPGTSPVSLQLARGGGSISVTRAGSRVYQTAGPAMATLADNLHCMEEDAAGVKYVGVFGQRQNICLYSADISNAAWTTPDGAARSATSVTAPDGNANTTCVLAEDGTTGLHYMQQSITVSNATRYCYSFWVKAINRTWFQAQFYDGTTVWDRYFQASGAGVVGGTGGTSPTTYGIYSEGGGWYRVWISMTTGNTTGNVYLIAAEADGDRDFVGGSQDSLAFWGMHLVAAAGPGPYIPTTSGAVTKNAEVISLPVGDYTIPGQVEMLVRTWDAVPTDKRLWSWYDASTDAAIELFLDSAGHVHLRVHDGTSENVDIEVATAVNDGAWHRVRAGWQTDNCALWVDGTTARDVSCAMPTAADLDVSLLGGSESGQYLDGHIREFRAYPDRRV